MVVVVKGTCAASCKREGLSDAFPGLQICQNCFCGWGSVADSAGGAYSAPPDPLAGLKGPTSKKRGTGGKRGRGWEGRVGGGAGQGEGMGGKGRGRGGYERGGGSCAPPF